MMELGGAPPADFAATFEQAKGHDPPLTTRQIRRVLKHQSQVTRLVCIADVFRS